MAAVGTVVVIGSIRGCSKKTTPIAKLSEVISGTADKSLQNSEWMSAAPGDKFFSGDAIRTDQEGGARLAFHNGALLRLGPQTTLVLGKRLSLVGEVENESNAPMTLKFKGEKNEVKLEPGAKIRVSKDGGKSSLELLVGAAVVTNEKGQFPLEVGKSIELVFGSSTTDSQAIDAGVPIDAAPPPIDAAPASSTITVALQGSARVKDTPDAKERRISDGDHELPSGAQISLRGRRSTAAFRRGDERAEMRGRGTAVVGEPGGPIATVSRGRVRLTGKAVATTIKVPGGTVSARAGRGRGSSIDVTVTSKSTIVPKSGRADVSSSKARERIQIGEKAEMTRGGDISVFGRQPKVADFSIRAGESAAVHDPGAPTALRVRFEDKCDDGVVEWKGGVSQTVRGNGSAITLLRKGSHRYQVFCIVDGDKQAASVSSGRIKLDGGRGTKPIPRLPPHNIIEATGENYEIRYQNLLPHVTIKWPNAKAEGRYKLNVKRSSEAAKTYTTKGPSHRVKNLAEGSYRFWFEGNGTRSKEGLLTIKFDNAATSAYLRRPKVGASWGSGQILVEGAGVPGTQVSVRGVQLETDRQHRFKVSVARPPNEAALAVKFVAPGQGTHYYIRRNGKR